MNREQRRHPEQPPAEEPSHVDPKHDPDAAMRNTDREQEDLSVRAKNTGHKKKTADKWNQ
jgi:hypothetical protein